jgi:CDP-paratose 2-epimerase
MKVMITGGAGCIGSNTADRFLRDGHHVVIIDDLSRKGASKNLQWLRTIGHPTLLQFDVADSAAMNRAVREHADAARVLHLAGQVAVTSAVKDPRHDFNANALGTLNLLEALREIDFASPILYASTNKVYGAMQDLRIVLRNERYDYENLPHGSSESRNLDFHSPYGCSKGAADQYMIDYARIYGLKTVVMRQSCIFGYRQFGLEDQGWVAWFMIATILGRPLTLYGDGRQVRDILFIDDLLDAYELAASNIERTRGQAYNIGGGRENIISLLDLVEFLSARTGRALQYTTSAWRPGDQLCFIADTRKAQRELSWRPKIAARVGLDRLYGWLLENRRLIE